jgi:hypothetical protein
LVATLVATLQPLRAAGHEVIVVDGGSTDATLALPRRSPTALSLHRPAARSR